MATREIIRMGHPALREMARDFSKEEILSEETEKLIKDMFDTMNKVGGIGLAAPQINIGKKLAIIEVPKDSERYPDSDESDTFIIFNPVISILDPKTQGFWEGCLSVPGLRGFVERPSKIKVNYLDEKACEQEIILDDFLATVFQHEIDHLFGTLYVDKITDTRLFSYEEEFEDFVLEDEDEEE